MFAQRTTSPILRTTNSLSPTKNLEETKKKLAELAEPFRIALIVGDISEVEKSIAIILKDPVQYPDPMAVFQKMIELAEGEKSSSFSSEEDIADLQEIIDLINQNISMLKGPIKNNLFGAAAS